MEYFSRSLDVFRAPNIPIHVIGAGAIGSFVVLGLAKAGFQNITVYDFDSVDEVNVGLQMYGPEHIGLPKVYALQQIIFSLAGLSIKIKQTKFSIDSPIDGFVYLCTDSMSSRTEVFNMLKGKMFGVKKVFDMRMGSEQLLCFSYDPCSDVETAEYVKSLYSDEDAAPQRCTEKGTSYTSLSAGGLGVSILKAFLSGKDLKFMSYDIAEGLMSKVQRT